MRWKTRFILLVLLKLSSLEESIEVQNDDLEHPRVPVTLSTDEGVESQMMICLIIAAWERIILTWMKITAYFTHCNLKMMIDEPRVWQTCSPDEVSHL